MKKNAHRGPPPGRRAPPRPRPSWAAAPRRPGPGPRRKSSRNGLNYPPSPAGVARAAAASNERPGQGISRGNDQLQPAHGGLGHGQFRPRFRLEPAFLRSGRDLRDRRGAQADRKGHLRDLRIDGQTDSAHAAGGHTVDALHGGGAKPVGDGKGPCASGAWASWARWTPRAERNWRKRKRRRRSRPKRRNNMPREIITIECTEARKEGKSPSRYTTTRNKKTQDGEAGNPEVQSRLAPPHGPS